jgi:hypothetical protein
MTQYGIMHTTNSFPNSMNVKYAYQQMIGSAESRNDRQDQIISLIKGEKKLDNRRTS